MKNTRQSILIITIGVLLIGLFASTVTAENAQEDKSDEYRKLLQTIDGATRTFRLEDNPSRSLANARSLYNSIILDTYENRGFDNNQELVDLDNRIIQRFNFLKGVWDNYGNRVAIAKNYYVRENITKAQYNRLKNKYYNDAREKTPESKFRDLRSDVTRMANALGIELSFQLKHALFIVFGLSIVAALGAAIVNRATVDWEKMNEVKGETQEWQKKLRRAQRKGKKKEVRKLKLQQDEVTKKQNTIWKVNVKQAIIYLIPFFLVWAWLSTIYQGWTVAWLPFNLPWFDFNLQLFAGTATSLGYLSWLLLTYFGFAQIWRRFLISS